MVLVCHVISKDHIIKRSCDFMGGSLLMVSHHPTKFGAHRHSGSAVCLKLKKRKIPDALASIRHYCLSLKSMTWKHTAYIINSDSGHAHLNQQLGKKLKITFVSPSKKRTVNHWFADEISYNCYRDEERLLHSTWVLYLHSFVDACCL